MVAPAAGEVKDDGPAVVDNAFVPRGGRLTGSRNVLLSVEVYPYWPQMSEVSPAQEPMVFSKLMAWLSNPTIPRPSGDVSGQMP